VEFTEEVFCFSYTDLQFNFRDEHKRELVRVTWAYARMLLQYLSSIHIHSLINAEFY